MAWKFGLWTLGGDRIGEVLNATERKVSLPLSAVPTASFQIRLDNPLANEITSRNGDVLLTVYQGSTLWFTGDLTTAEEVGGEGTTLQCNFAGPLWRLQKRLAGKVVSPGYTDSSVSRGTVAQTLLSVANTEKDTGIRAGTTATLHPTSVGPWYYKPVAEAFSEMAALKLYPFEDITSSPAIVDTFTTGTSALTGRTLETPAQTWSTLSGVSDDYQVASGAAGRSVTVDPGQFAGRMARAGTNSYTNVMAQINYGQTISDGPSSGVWCRGTSGTEVLIARRQQGADGTTISATKWTAGGDATLGSVQTALTPDGELRSLRLQAHDDGSWFVWDYETAVGPVFPMLSGVDSDLATGGPLETGGVGIYDKGTTGQTAIRYYFDFYAKVPTVAITLQGFEYELVPSEPTVDGDGVKIATLNASARLGTDKPNVIFEYGAGNRSVKSYQRVFDRGSLLTQGYTLTDTDVRKSFDLQAIADRGLYEEVVPNDLGDAGLRQALADAHVIVRKQAKQTVTFAPSTQAPVFGTDYVVGDTVRARVSANGVARLSGTLRVYGVEVSIDPEGKEEVSPVLVEE